MRIFFRVLLTLFVLNLSVLGHAEAPTQLQLNDAAILEDFCTLFEAERVYYNYYSENFPNDTSPYTSDINELISGNYLLPSWATADPLTRNGYALLFGASNSTYSITATPIVPGVTGSWNLYGDWRQTIHLGTDGTDPLFDYSPCDIAKDIATNEENVIEDLYAVSIILQMESLTSGYKEDFLDYAWDGERILFGQWWDGDRRRYGYAISYRGENNNDYGDPCPTCRYSMVAVPEQFGITGNRAFYLDQSGVIRAENYRNAGPASPPISDTATYPPNLLPDYFRNEILIINDYACQIYQAELNYFADNSIYTGIWNDLTGAVPPYLEGNWNDPVNGYDYRFGGNASGYYVVANAETQGVSGSSSFFFGEPGILRVLRFGPGVTSEDTPLGNVCDEIIKLNPTPPAETPPALYHSGDPAQNYHFSLSELLRFIQFFNVGALSCSPGSEDGFTAGAGDTSCAAHSGDFDVQDWTISLNELLRFIQLYNRYGYFPCPNPDEDGYCPIL